MKRKGLFLLLCAVLAAGSLLFWHILKYKGAQYNSNRRIVTQEKTVADLEAQVRQLREKIKALEMSGSGEGAVSVKNRIAELQEKLNESVSQNKELAGKIMVMMSDREHLKQLRKTLDQAMARNKKISSEVVLLKNKMDFARPLEERLSRVGNALVMINAKQVKEKQIKMQLEALVDELGAINANVSQLFGPDSGFADGPGILSSPLTVLDNRKDRGGSYSLSGQIPVTWSDTYQALKSEMNRMQEQINGLNKRYQDALETIKINQVELSSRAEKILSLQEKITQSEAKLGQMQGKSQEMIKDSAVLREQFVYIQLERERLIAELNQARSRLNELQEKLGRIGNIFGDGGPEEAKNPAPVSQKVNVELIPQAREDGVTVSK